MEIPDSIREQVLREVIDTAPFPIGVYTGHKMKIVLANKCMIKTYGKGPDVIGTNYTDILPELENQEIFEQLREVLATGEPFEAKNARVDIVIDGVLKPHYFNYNFTPIFDNEGRVYGVMNTAAEVTELNISRQANVEAEKKLRMAVESAQLGTFEIDLESGAIKGSKSFYSFFDSEDPDFSLSEALSCLHPEDVGVWNAAMEKLHVLGKLQCEIRVEGRDGIRWVRLTGALSDTDNKENTIVGIAQDISEERHYADELAKLVEIRTVELKRSNDDLKQFGHVLSHDLKEPIRKISVFSNLLREFVDENTSPRVDQFIQKINKSSKRVTEMVDSILNYSSSDSERLDDIVDLNAILKGIREDLELKIAETNATIEYDRLPTLKGSKVLLHQLFLNLISNSLKFSRAEAAPQIKIYHEGDLANSLSIYLEDNGIGIEKQYLDKIFNTFERLHSKEEYEGTGLGLALCKKIAERHGGSITASTPDNYGARFQITFPSSIRC